MPGFYIHIPLCRKVCYYCDFHFVASLLQKKLILNAIKTEIKERKDLWKNTKFNTLYIGGGTPSVLSVDEINQITNEVFANYSFDSNIEFTLEANPDDLTIEYLQDLNANTKINRLSIGVQSFHDKDLIFINRRHNGNEAISCIKNAKSAGFDNVTIDLIYGIPGLSLQDWEINIETLLELNIPHLAAYHLSIEPKTIFGVFQKRNKIQPINEELSVKQYELLISKLNKVGYEHYEIANFAKDGAYSKHNTGYWLGEKYIGIGPSAHSFDGITRHWNISNNTKYCNSLKNGKDDYYENESLSKHDLFNDYLLTSLRTIWGADLQHIRNSFGKRYAEHCLKIIDKFTKTKHIISNEKVFRFTEKGWFISDSVLADLFIDE